MASVGTTSEYDFVKEPSQEYFCPVTKRILMDPQQTNKCCGKHLSRAVADRSKREKAPCPLCGCESWETVDDLYFKRQVSDLKVRCKNKALGCEWEGELGNLSKHMMAGSEKGECKCEKVACPYRCGDQFQRRYLSVHKTECGKRPFSCPYCSLEGTYEMITRDRWPKCQRYPLKCPNKCCEEGIERRFLKHHLDQNCPLQEIACEFRYTGCRVRMERWKMRDHMDRNVDEHLDALATHVKAMMEMFKAQIYALSLYVPEPVFVHPPTMDMNNFKEKMKNNDVWYSPSFRTHIGGYKMRLHVHANGWREGKSTHVSVVVCIMKGEFDDHLQWPFKGEVTVQLINQREGGKHVEKTIVKETDMTEDNLCHVLEGDIVTERCGQAMFISHADLYKPESDMLYLLHNTLMFSVTRVVVKSI